MSETASGFSRSREVDQYCRGAEAPKPRHCTDGPVAAKITESKEPPQSKEFKRA